MPAFRFRPATLIASACAVFWPGSFIFALPGVLRQHLLLPHLSHLWLWAVLAAVIGYAFATLFAVSAPLAGEIFSMAHFGAIFGAVFTAWEIGLHL